MARRRRGRCGSRLGSTVARGATRALARILALCFSTLARHSSRFNELEPVQAGRSSRARPWPTFPRGSCPIPASTKRRWRRGERVDGPLAETPRGRAARLVALPQPNRAVAAPDAQRSAPPTATALTHLPALLSPGRIRSADTPQSACPARAGRASAVSSSKNFGATIVSAPPHLRNRGRGSTR